MRRSELVMAGVGGMGVLVAGQTLSRAAFHEYQHASYVPSFGFARRGGNSEFTVIFSNEKISSPLLDKAEVVVLLDSSQFGTYESRVRPNGALIVEKAGLAAEQTRDDYKLCALAGMQLAVDMGASVLVGLIMLGGYVAIAESISPQPIEDELRRRYGDNGGLLERNLSAFRRGLDLGRTAK